MSTLKELRERRKQRYLNRVARSLPDRRTRSSDVAPGDDSAYLAHKWFRDNRYPGMYVSTVVIPHLTHGLAHRSKPDHLARTQSRATLDLALTMAVSNRDRIEPRKDK